MGLLSFFSEKKPLGSEEYEKLSKRIVDLEVKLQNFEAELNKFDGLLRSLRGLVNKKLGYANPEDAPAETEPEQTSETLLSPVLLPEYAPSYNITNNPRRKS